MTATRVIAGHVIHDRVGARQTPGGCAWHGAQAWRRLGHAPTLVTAVGDDFAHDRALVGLGARVQRGGRTTAFATDPPGSGPRQVRCDALAPPVQPPAGLESELLVLAPVLGEIDRAAWHHVLARWVVLGLQGWIRRRGPGGYLVNRPAAVSPDLWAGTDAVALSEEDLNGDHEWLALLARRVPVVALTQGEAGCTVFTCGRAHQVPTRAVPAPETTGAGDTWLAVFADGLADGRPPAAAAARANEQTGRFLAARVQSAAGQRSQTTGRWSQ